jgi:hypothetical protein
MSSLWLALLFTFLPGILAQAQCTTVELPIAQGGILAGAQADVDRITVTEVASDHIRLAFSLSLLSNRDVAVRQISFENMRLNDVPFYATPMVERLRLVAGQKLALANPVQVALYYRDLDSVRPLEQLLRESQASVEGTLHLDVELSLLQRVALLAGRGNVPVTLRRQLPIEVPGGPLGRAAAIGNPHSS